MGIMIKYAMEHLQDVPADWTDEQIDADLNYCKTYPYRDRIWCPYDEQLFDNPHINKHYVEKLGPAPGYKRIRYAQEEVHYPSWPWTRSKEDLEDYVRSRCWHGRSYIWCYGNEELFKGD